MRQWSVRRAALAVVFLLACGDDVRSRRACPDCGDADAAFSTVADGGGEAPSFDAGVVRADGGSDVASDAGSTVGGEWPAECVGDRITVYLDGAGYVLDGTRTITEGRFESFLLPDLDRAALVVRPADQPNVFWNLLITTPDPSIPLHVGVYEDARREPGDGHPGLAVSGEGRSCGQESAGRFEIFSFEHENGILIDLTMSFEQHCLEVEGSDVLRGCVRFRNTNARPPVCSPTPPFEGDGFVAASSKHAIEVVGSSDLGLALPADGHTPIPLLVSRVAPPNHDQELVLRASRPVGRFEPPTVVLGKDPVTAYFVPCDACEAGCLGDLGLAVATAAEPGIILATVDVSLVEPVHVGWPAACMGSGNVIHFHGNDWIYDGIQTVRDGDWTAGGGDEGVLVEVTPTGAPPGLRWATEFRVPVNGPALGSGVYNDAERFTDNGHAAMQVYGFGRACNEIAGRFEVLDYVHQNGPVTDLRVSFDQVCEPPPPNVVVVPLPLPRLHGCVHYAAP